MIVWVTPAKSVSKSARWKYRTRALMFVCSPDGLDKLHTFAESIGLKREWFHLRQTVPCYWITEGMQKKALSMGANLACKTEFRYAAEQFWEAKKPKFQQ